MLRINLCIGGYIETPLPVIHIIHIIKSILSFIGAVAVITGQRHIIFFNTCIIQFGFPCALIVFPVIRKVHSVAIQIALIMNLRFQIRGAALYVPFKIFRIPFRTEGKGIIFIDIINPE